MLEKNFFFWWLFFPTKFGLFLFLQMIFCKFYHKNSIFGWNRSFHLKKNYKNSAFFLQLYSNIANAQKYLDMQMKMIPKKAQIVKIPREMRENFFTIQKVKNLHFHPHIVQILKHFSSKIFQSIFYFSRSSDIEKNLYHLPRSKIWIAAQIRSNSCFFLINVSGATSKKANCSSVIWAIKNEIRKSCTSYKISNRFTSGL